MTKNTTTTAGSEPVAGPVQRLVRPHLVPVSHGYWGMGHLSNAGDELGLRKMCDYGAKQFYAGRCDLVNFDCMPDEVEQIKDYMAEKHPSVAYAIGPAQRTLARAVAAWEAVSRPNC